MDKTFIGQNSEIESINQFWFFVLPIATFLSGKVHLPNRLHSTVRKRELRKWKRNSDFEEMEMNWKGIELLIISIKAERERVFWAVFVEAKVGLVKKIALKLEAQLNSQMKLRLGTLEEGLEVQLLAEGEIQLLEKFITTVMTKFSVI